MHGSILKCAPGQKWLRQWKTSPYSWQKSFKKIFPHSSQLLYEISILNFHYVLVHFHSNWWQTNGISYGQENVTFKWLILQCAGCRDLWCWCCPSGRRLFLNGEMWCQRSDAVGLYNTFYEHHQISFSLSLSICLSYDLWGCFSPFHALQLFSSGELAAAGTFKYKAPPTSLSPPGVLGDTACAQDRGWSERINLGDFSSLLIVLMEVKQSQPGIKKDHIRCHYVQWKCVWGVRGQWAKYVLEKVKMTHPGVNWP